MKLGICNNCVYLCTMVVMREVFGKPVRRVEHYCKTLKMSLDAEMLECSLYENTE